MPISVFYKHPHTVFLMKVILIKHNEISIVPKAITGR